MTRPQARTESKPIRPRWYDPDLNTTRTRTVAWRITCQRCGTSATGRYPSVALSKLDGHECDPHG